MVKVGIVLGLALGLNVAFGKPPVCPKRGDTENCTAEHKKIFNQIINSYGSLLGGVEISQLHSLCSSYTVALRCLSRLDADCTRRNLVNRRREQLFNISALCFDREATALENYSLHHHTCFLNPGVRQAVKSCWDDFEASVGQNQKLTPIKHLYPLESKVITVTASNTASQSQKDASSPSETPSRSTQPHPHMATICKLQDCLFEAIKARCYDGADALVNVLALPLPPFSKQQYYINCSSHFSAPFSSTDDQLNSKQRNRADGSAGSSKAGAGSGSVKSAARLSSQATRIGCGSSGVWVMALATLSISRIRSSGDS